MIIKFSNDNIMGIIALILTWLIAECIHFGIILLIWKFFIINIFDVPMINFGEAIILEILVKLLIKSHIIKPIVIRKPIYSQEDIEE